MKYPELPRPYIGRSSIYPALYSSIQMYDYCDAGIIELDKLLDKAIQEIDDLKLTNEELKKENYEAGAKIEQLLTRICDLETELYGEEL